MRVLLITDWPEIDGGAERHVVDLAAELRAAGDEVLIVVSDRGAGREVADVVVRSAGTTAAKAVMQVSNPFAANAVRRAVASFRPDAAFVWMFEQHLSPSAVFALGRVPYVLNVVWYKPVCPTGTKLLPSGQLCQVRAGRPCLDERCLGRAEAARAIVRYRRIGRVVRSAARVVACSSWMVAELARNGLAATYLPLPAVPPSKGYARRPADRPLLVSVGRLSPEKGLEILLAAIALLGRRGFFPTLRVVGDGPLRPALERHAVRAGLADQIEWVGPVAHREVERHLGDAWALVAPSLWAEPLGLSAVEAIIRGVPVVASRTGGYAETVEEGRTGWLFPNGDVAALAALLETVVAAQAFTDHTVAAEASAALASRHDPRQHAAVAHALLEEIAS